MNKTGLNDNIPHEILNKWEHEKMHNRVICPYCNQPAQFVDNAEIYGRRYGKSYMMWWCRPCDALVGTHQNNPDSPLGTLANKELRVWRRKAHAAFDPLWKSGKMTRQEAYHWLKEQTGQWIHMGEADIDLCKKVIELVEMKEKDAK